ncbi:hypothetical protein V8C35DRAFT_305202 [Trichoderma chlorosporum]
MDSSIPEDQMRKLASILSDSLVHRLLHLQGYGLYAHPLDLAEKQREVFRKLHHDMGRSDLEEPVEEYLTDLEARKLIFDKFKTLAYQLVRSYGPKMTLFAVFMIAPIDILRSRVEALEMCHLNDPAAAEAQLAQWQDIVTAGMRTFANRENEPQTSSPQERPAKRRRLSHKSSSSESKTLEPPSPRPRTRGPPVDAKKAARLCKFRDGNVCHFTGMPAPVAAHIFPSVGSRLSDITAMLEIFWGADAANRLSELATGKQNMLEDPQNLVSLNRQLQWYFNNGRMALKPLREAENGAVTVQFHWLNFSKYYPEGTIYDACWDELIYRAGLRGCENQFPRRNDAHRPSGLPLETGQTFTFRGHYGRRICTPNFHLLQLSWDLRRVAAIAGVTRDGLGSENAATDNEWFNYMYSHHSSYNEDYDEEQYDEEEGYDEEQYDDEEGCKEHYDAEEDYNEEDCNGDVDHYNQDLGTTEANPDSQEEDQHSLMHEWAQNVQAESGNEGGEEDFLGDV